jgi:hypothetical protein
MGTDFYTATGSIAIAFLLYTWLMIYNYRNIIASKKERLEARRRQRAARKTPFVFPL